MKVIIAIVVFILILYFIGKYSKSDQTKGETEPKGGAKPARSAGASSGKDRILRENISWLKERWERVQKEKDSGELRTVREWYFDEATQKQIDRIDKIGLKTKLGQLTKGQASDIIGIFEPPDNEMLLKFFKIPLKGMNQSKSIEIATKLLLDPDNVKAWEGRPATQMQKEFFRYFKLKLPKGLTYNQAEKLISKFEMEQEEDSDRLDEWYEYEDLFELINDIDTRREFGIKKVSLTAYRQAIEDLRKEGKSVSEIAQYIGDIIDKIVEIKPNILTT
jgi:hypothetical protein